MAKAPKKGKKQAAKRPAKKGKGELRDHDVEKAAGGVFVTQILGATGDDSPTESVSFVYGKPGITYVKQ